MNALVAKALADPTLKTRYGDLGASTWPTSQAEIKAFRDSEEKRLLPIMKAAGIKPEVRRAWPAGTIAATIMVSRSVAIGSPVPFVRHSPGPKPLNLYASLMAQT